MGNYIFIYACRMLGLRRVLTFFAVSGRILHGCPTNMTYMWNFGVYSLVCLMLQVLTGVFLAMFYVADVEWAFLSIEYVMRDVSWGWLIRYLHGNGASFFFLAVYLHVFRGLYYGSYTYPREFVWLSGVILLMVMVVTAFSGYILVWGQMSFWAATVITNLVTAVPLIGKDVVIWIWGGMSVGNAMLSRFYSLHYLLPFVLVGLVGVHVLLVQDVGSNGYLGLANVLVDDCSFYPYYVLRDFLGVLGFLLLLWFMVFFHPCALGEFDNFVMANALVTPLHIIPNWYLTPFFSVLRGIPDKLGGVVGLLGAIGVLGLVPYFFKCEVRSSVFRPLICVCFWCFVGCCLLLGFLGGCVVEKPFSWFMRGLTVFYFAYFLFLIPVLVMQEKRLWDNFWVNRLK